MPVSSFYGWVGSCQVCGELGYVQTSCYYHNGVIKTWGERFHLTGCLFCPREIALSDANCTLTPLKWESDQAPYRAAYLMGGIVAVEVLLREARTQRKR